MKRLMLVDGSNLLFQMFYGMPSRIVNRDGKPIQGTLGFVGALLKMIRMINPTHLAVFFDGECANPRQKLDGEYKANRVDYSKMAQEDTPFYQLPDIFCALDYLKIPYQETKDCEADDWFAGYALGMGEDCEITIVSQDSDFFSVDHASGTGSSVPWKTISSLRSGLYSGEVGNYSTAICSI